MGMAAVPSALKRRLLALPLGLLLAGAEAPAARSDRLPWHGKGVWLQGDHHLHSMLIFKTGPAIVQAASDWKLDFIVSTEHAERAFRSGIAERLAAFRRNYPRLVILAGIEWNIPGAGHATLAVEPSLRELPWLMEFSQDYDVQFRGGASDLGSEEDGIRGDLQDAIAGLRWLQKQEQSGGLQAVVYLEHPSKKERPTDDQIARLQAAGMAGVTAGPGHQKLAHPGTDRTIDRYEPYFAVIGGGYDQLLAQGRYLGLSAVSDFHAEKSSYLPGQFSRSLVYCPSRTARGAIEGLKAGATAAVVGGLVTSVETRTAAQRQKDFAMISETLTVPVGAQLTYSVQAEVPRLDFRGQPNRLDRVEIISNCLGKPELVKLFDSIGYGAVKLTYALPHQATAKPGTFYLRSRGRRFVGGPGDDASNADYLFYTGATFVRVVQQTKGRP
jgi:hypothetical protein